MAARVSAFCPTDRACPTTGAAFGTGPRPAKSASTQRRPTLWTSSDASSEPRTTLRTSSDVSTKRRPPVRPISFVSEERRPAVRPFDFHVLSFLPGRIADETGFPPVRTRRRQAKAVPPPSEHRTCGGVTLSHGLCHTVPLSPPHLFHGLAPGVPDLLLVLERGRSGLHVGNEARRPRVGLRTRAHPASRVRFQASQRSCQTPAGRSPEVQCVTG
jgi:hypothetical protein